MFGDMAVLICGPMRAGKTTASKYLAENHWFKEYSVAGKLKELHKTVTGSLEKDREWLQNVGHAARVVFGENFWVDRLVEQLSIEKPKRFVVDDVRYKNELTGLLAFAKANYSSVVVLIVDISAETQITRGAEIALLHHESENFARKLLNQVIYVDDSEKVGCILEFDMHAIRNNGSFKEFYKSIEEVCDFKNHEKNNKIQSLYEQRIHIDVYESLDG